MIEMEAVCVNEAGELREKSAETATSGATGGRPPLGAATVTVSEQPFLQLFPMLTRIRENPNTLKIRLDQIEIYKPK